VGDPWNRRQTEIAHADADADADADGKSEA